MINLGEYSNEVINKYKLDDHPTGSNYICDPPVTDTDVDWVVLVTDRGKVITELDHLGWDYTYDYVGGHGDFTSVRRGEINLILVDDKKEFDLWVKATEEAKRLNLRNKQERIDLFSRVWKSEKKKGEEKAGPLVFSWGDVIYYPTYTGIKFYNYYPTEGDVPQDKEPKQGWKPEKIPTQKKRKTVAAYLTNLLGVMRA